MNYEAEYRKPNAEHRKPITMQNTWDERYSTPDYIYGKEPNLWFKAFIDSHQPGRVYLPGEGEGRNAVYAAKKGWTVDAADQSPIARDKAMKLAGEAGVSISYTVGDILLADLTAETYDAVGLIYIHKNPAERNIFYPALIRALKPGGYLVLEGFNKKQVNNTSGGPDNPEILFSIEELREGFKDLVVVELEEQEQVLEEGLLHVGKADTVRLLAVKKF
jgi:SAM-dependent methyltransferase